jgi:hypothetical protein
MQQTYLFNLLIYEVLILHKKQGGTKEKQCSLHPIIFPLFLYTSLSLGARKEARRR